MYGVKNKLYGLCALAAMVSTVAHASLFTASGVNPASGNALAASANFTVSAGNLVVTLCNTSTDDTTLPTDVLTAVFFDIAGNPTLTPVSALLEAGSTVIYDSQPAGGVVGGEWAYGNGLSTPPAPATQGISSAGFGAFGNANFPGANLAGPTAVDGLQYGIVSAGDDVDTGNTGITGSGGLIKNCVVFTLDNLPGSFTLDDISNVSFQYGTAFGEPNIPEPTTVIAGALLLLPFAASTVRRFRRS
jgi:hypothetical protein